MTYMMFLVINLNCFDSAIGNRRSFQYTYESPNKHKFIFCLTYKFSHSLYKFYAQPAYVGAREREKEKEGKWWELGHGPIIIWICSGFIITIKYVIILYFVLLFHYFFSSSLLLFFLLMICMLYLINAWDWLTKLYLALLKVRNNLFYLRVSCAINLIIFF